MMYTTNKMLEVLGFIFIGGTIYSYLGISGNELKWPVFILCAVCAFLIIVYLKKNRHHI